MEMRFIRCVFFANNKGFKEQSQQVLRARVFHRLAEDNSWGSFGQLTQLLPGLRKPVAFRSVQMSFCKLQRYQHRPQTVQVYEVNQITSMKT